MSVVIVIYHVGIVVVLVLDGDGVDRRGISCNAYRLYSNMIIMLYNIVKIVDRKADLKHRCLYFL